MVSVVGAEGLRERKFSVGWFWGGGWDMVLLLFEAVAFVVRSMES